MKIGIICQNFPPAHFEGGIAHYSRKLAENLIRLGHAVYAITSTEFSKPTNPGESPAGLEIIMIRGPWKFSAVNEIREAVVSKRIDCVILQYSPSSFDVRFRLRWAVFRFPCQKITAFHTLWGGRWDRIVGVLNLFGSTKIIATNSEIMGILEKRLPSLLKKTYWVPIGTNISPPVNWFDLKPVPSPTIAYFGMLYPGKGLDLILDTIELLRDRGNSFVFKIIGGGMLGHEDYEERYRYEIQKRNLANIVDWVGLAPEETVSQELRKSRIVFLPFDRGLSDRRGSFMAAVAHSRPVLTSPPVVIMPYLKNGTNVVWPQTTSAKHYADLLEQLLADDRFVSKLSEGALQLGFKFQWDKIARDYERTLSSCQ